MSQLMRIVGLISGTSADGIDAALAEIDVIDDKLEIRQRAFRTLPWTSEQRALIFRLFSDETSTAELCRANFQLGEAFGQAALTIIELAGFTPADIDLIGSHGQTVWHDVDDKGQVTSTLQIGEPAVIAELTGVTTIADFRVADVAAGGQGAPLVSIFDWLMLRPPPELEGVRGGWRAVQNIGGIANVTFLPPVDVDAAPLAFDTGPGNVFIDWAITQISGGAEAYDAEGRLAAQGQTRDELLRRWLDLPYFQQKPPKTTGRELFDSRLAEQWYRQAMEMGLSNADFVATVTELTAASIAQAYARFAPGPIAQVAIAGGGAHNPTLMAMLERWLARLLPGPPPIKHQRELGIDVDAKEALTFALLAYLTWYNRPGNLPACTGARGQRVLGKIVPGWRETRPFRG
jgi:anhydro-N-acetylmuramic acid kinase